MLKLLKNPAQIVTVDTGGKNCKRGVELSNAGVMEGHSILIENGVIKDILPSAAAEKMPGDVEVINCTDKVILPGLVECHTHTVFAGSRANEFRLKLKGATYEEIARSGGGINATVSAVRKASFEELVKIVKPRIDDFVAQGVTTLEIKSGYGLNFENEIKILNVIKYFKENYPIDIAATFLGAHTYPAEYKENHAKYLDEITGMMLPFIAGNKLAEFCDGFCEKTAFSPEDINYIFTIAGKLGLKLKLHTDQFNSIGGLDVALKHKAVSVDHLEALDDKDVHRFADSGTTAVLLPGVSYFLNYSFAPARKLIENNAILALATDYNPGSCNISNISMIMSLASLKMKLSIEEIISAYTINAAKALNRSETTGSIEIGKKADFAVFDTNDYTDLIYNAGKNLNIMTIKEGAIIYSKKWRF